ncbi:MAG: type IV pilus biogenesis/stability protein PilW [Betaproteobacteria bacterium]|nr:type IV pilus biogenesis/stability protein PilW [Betaproteobacteria bacterium]
MKRFAYLPFMLAFVLLLSFLPEAAKAQQVYLPDSSSVQPIANDPRTQARLHTELAALYFEGGAFSIALEESNIAITADSSYAPAFNLRALIYTTLRDNASAESDFKRAISISPNDPEINNNYGWFLCQQADPAKQKAALAHFIVAVRNPLYETPDRAYANAGSCALKTGDKETARDHLLNAIRFAPDGAPTAQVLLAQMAYEEGSIVEARNRLLELFQTGWQPSAEALWLGIRVENKLGNHMEEKSLATQLRRRYPASPEYQTYLKGNYQ